MDLSPHHACDEAGLKIAATRPDLIMGLTIFCWKMLVWEKCWFALGQPKIIKTMVLSIEVAQISQFHNFPKPQRLSRQYLSAFKWLRSLNFIIFQSIIKIEGVMLHRCKLSHFSKFNKIKDGTPRFGWSSMKSLPSHWP